MIYKESDYGDFQDITITLVWPDGTADTIRCKHTVATALAVSNRYELNGKKTSPPIILVK